MRAGNSLLALVLAAAPAPRAGDREFQERMAFYHPQAVRAFDVFFQRLMAALEADDPVRVAPLVRYPLRVRARGATVTVAGPAAFVQRARDLLPPAFTARLVGERESLRCLSGGVALGRGDLWFGLGPGGAWEMRAVNPAAPSRSVRRGPEGAHVGQDGAGNQLPGALPEPSGGKAGRVSGLQEARVQEHQEAPVRGGADDPPRRLEGPGRGRIGVGVGPAASVPALEVPAHLLPLQVEGGQGRARHHAADERLPGAVDPLGQGAALHRQHHHAPLPPQGPEERLDLGRGGPAGLDQHLEAGAAGGGRGSAPAARSWGRTPSSCPCRTGSTRWRKWAMRGASRSRAR